MNHLEQLRHHAAAMLGRLIDAAAQQGRTETLMKHSLPVADALASYAIAALVSDPEGAIARPAITAAGGRAQTKLPDPAPEP